MSNGGRPPNGRTNLVNLGGHGGQNVKKEDALPTGGHVASLPAGRTSDQSLFCLLRAGNPATPGIAGKTLTQAGKKT